VGHFAEDAADKVLIDLAIEYWWNRGKTARILLWTTDMSLQKEILAETGIRMGAWHPKAIASLKRRPSKAWLEAAKHPISAGGLVDAIRGASKASNEGKQTADVILRSIQDDWAQLLTHDVASQWILKCIMFFGATQTGILQPKYGLLEAIVPIWHTLVTHEFGTHVVLAAQANMPNEMLCTIIENNHEELFRLSKDPLGADVMKSLVKQALKTQNQSQTSNRNEVTNRTAPVDSFIQRRWIELTLDPYGHKVHDSHLRDLYDLR